ncbi:MAG: hypothetical protein QM754_10770 [Tepidisphaeraceae bacterium]
MKKNTTGKTPVKQIPRTKPTVSEAIKEAPLTHDDIERARYGEIPVALKNAMSFAIEIWGLRNRLMLYLHASGLDFNTNTCVKALETAAEEARTTLLKPFFEVSKGDMHAVCLSLILKGDIYKVPGTLEAVRALHERMMTGSVQNQKGGRK